MYREFWRTLTQDPRQLRMAIAIWFVGILASLLEGLNIGLLVPLLETLGTTDQEDGHWVSRGVASIFESVGLSYRLETILLALGVMVLVLAALKYIRFLLVFKSRADFITWLRSRTMTNVLNTDISYFHREKIGTLTSTITTQAEESGAILVSINDFVSVSGLAIAYMVMALIISPALSATALALIVLVSLGLQLHIRMAGKMGQALVDSNFALHENAVENLSGIRVTKSFTLERPRMLQFNKVASDLGNDLYKVNRNFSQITVIQETVLFGLVAGIVYVGVNVLSLDIAIIVTMLFVLYRLNPRITTLNAIRHNLASKMPAFAAINATIKETGITRVASGAVPFHGLEDKIEMQSVFFSYISDSQVISDASFSIEKGQITALAGPSGAGKSTIVDLVQRFYDPVKGTILVDGQDLRDLDLKNWRDSIGVVSQDVFLFNDTVAANIGLAREEVTDDAIKDAARQAFAHDFILELPQGYDTLVGDRGLNLSGGQRQRIALARAILKKPTLLILDEATSSLDSESEQLVRQYIQGIREEVTVLVVAHRMATIQDADKIIVLEDGKVMQEGDWDGLLAEEGTLSQYHRLQSGM